MTTLTKSTNPIKEGQIKRNWYLIDVKNKVLGRIVTDVARFLQGKHKVNYAPYLDGGDYVIVTNAKNVKVTGRKSTSKTYIRYSGYPGGLKSVLFDKLLEKNPSKIIQHAVSGMLPKNKFRKRRLTRLFIFPDEKHPYEDKLK